MVQELLQQLRVKGWGDSDVGDALGVDRVTIYRWRMGQRRPDAEKMVIDTLKRLLRRRGPPRRKEPAGV
jgi:transcriptional regulator with XRE-family HTH domain